MVAELTAIEQAVLQLIGAFAGGLVGILTALLIAARAEWFRKLARWEPYARDLWAERLAVVRRVVTLAHEVNMAAYLSVAWEERRVEYQKRTADAQESLLRATDVRVLCSSEFPLCQHA